jgi:hypothetical protein
MPLQLLLPFAASLHDTTMYRAAGAVDECNSAHFVAAAGAAAS